MDESIDYKSIGIAIINTDRAECLNRLIASIVKNTEREKLNSLIVNVVDDSRESAKIESLCKQYSFVKFHHTGTRIGIAKNTNEALYLLRDRELSFIFNNDCEVLKKGWMEFYITSMRKCNIHHFCFHQEGLWGAGTARRPETRSIINGIEIKTIHNYPQGALLVFDKKAFDTVGYFDSKNFISYGLSHWMWSFSISESNIQPKGIHDVIGSNKYFKVHDEPSATPPKERIESYRRNTLIFEEEFRKLKIGKRPVYTPRGA